MENLENYLDINNWIAGDRELQLLGILKNQINQHQEGVSILMSLNILINF